mgnify:CR=1 FL=1
MGLRIDYRLALTSASVSIESRIDRSSLLGNCPSALPAPTKNLPRCRNLASTPGTPPLSPHPPPLSLTLAFAYESELGVRDGQWLAAVAGDDSAGPREREPSPYGGTGTYRTLSATALQISVTDTIFSLLFSYLPGIVSRICEIFQGSKGKYSSIVCDDGASDKKREKTLVIYNDTALKRALEAAAD